MFKEIAKTIGGILTILLVLFGVGWLATGNNLALMKVFAPMFEQTRRETFEQSKAFRDGAIQELRSMQFEYVKAAPEHKAGLAGVIRHKADSIPEGALPYDLQQFVKELP